MIKTAVSCSRCLFLYFWSYCTYMRMFVSLSHKYLQNISSIVSTVSSVSQVVVLVARLLDFSLLSRFNFKQQQQQKETRLLPVSIGPPSG